jgi:hypothetical protein
MPVQAISATPAGVLVTVTASATLILPAATRIDAVIQNAGSNPMVVSASPTLTFAGAGYILAAGESLPWPYNAACYGICDTGDTTTVRGLDCQ